MLLVLAMCLGLGALAGLLSGLLGIGGGLVIVPALVWMLPQLGITPALVMPAALATSLATICVTGSSSVLAHHRRQSVPWQHARWLVIGMMAGGVLGAQIATLMDGVWLKRLFAFFLIISALRMVWRQKREPHPDEALKVTGPLLAVLTLIVGALASMLGIGGGVMLVPLLTALGMGLTQSVASAATCTLAVAVSGTLSYAISGWHHPDLPAHSLGFVYWPVWLALLPGAFLMPPVGVRLLHRLPAARVRQGFALLLAFIAFEMMFG
ncbi:sulfite exporter TauE/SafE family protein [Gallaecimonas sp. GXIMD1310]|uniref:sulfite exporter TauE/SafE family protein n=1 Tax=Gallaecimonas sp. GXIMD1310 TaxID=3131926 RepID=UPI0032537F80